MGRIVATEFVPLDGVIEDPGGSENFEHATTAPLSSESTARIRPRPRRRSLPLREGLPSLVQRRAEPRARRLREPSAVPRVPLMSGYSVPWRALVRSAEPLSTL